MEKSILKVENLNKIYHTEKEEIKAVENINFDLKKGEFISIVGPSGCGKSTILSMICKLLENSSGNIILKDGYTIGYMLQEDNLLDFRTILKNCLIGLEIKHQLNEENINYVKQLLQTYGLKDFMNSHPNELSGGMRQRVALIRTLSTKPDILLMDEPFSALDFQTRLAVSNDVYNIIKKEHKSAIMVTHDLAEAISMSDRVIVMSSRPGTIKNIYDIKLTNRSTPIENRNAKEFSYYHDLIWKDIDFHV